MSRSRTLLSLAMWYLNILGLTQQFEWLSMKIMSSNMSNLPLIALNYSYTLIFSLLLQYMFCPAFSYQYIPDALWWDMMFWILNPHLLLMYNAVCFTNLFCKMSTGLCLQYFLYIMFMIWGKGFLSWRFLVTVSNLYHAIFFIIFHHFRSYTHNAALFMYRLFRWVQINSQRRQDYHDIPF